MLEVPDCGQSAVSYARIFIITPGYSCISVGGSNPLNDQSVFIVLYPELLFGITLGGCDIVKGFRMESDVVWPTLP